MVFKTFIPHLALVLAGCLAVNSPNRLLYSTHASFFDDRIAGPTSGMEVAVMPTKFGTRAFELLEYENFSRPWSVEGIMVEFLVDTDTDLKAGRQDMRDAELMVRVVFQSEADSAGSHLVPVAGLYRRSKGDWSRSEDLSVHWMLFPNKARSGVTVEVPDSLFGSSSWFTWRAERMNGADTLRLPPRPYLHILDEKAFLNRLY